MQQLVYCNLAFFSHENFLYHLHNCQIFVFMECNKLVQLESDGIFGDYFVTNYHFVNETTE